MELALDRLYDTLSFVPNYIATDSVQLKLQCSTSLWGSDRVVHILPGPNHRCVTSWFDAAAENFFEAVRADHLVAWVVHRAFIRLTPSHRSSSLLLRTVS